MNSEKFMMWSPGVSRTIDQLLTAAEKMLERDWVASKNSITKARNIFRRHFYTIIENEPGLKLPMTIFKSILDELGNGEGVDTKESETKIHVLISLLGGTMTSYLDGTLEDFNTMLRGCSLAIAIAVARIREAEDALTQIEMTRHIGEEQLSGLTARTGRDNIDVFFDLLLCGSSELLGGGTPSDVLLRGVRNLDMVASRLRRLDGDADDVASALVLVLDALKAQKVALKVYLNPETAAEFAV